MLLTRKWYFIFVIGAMFYGIAYWRKNTGLKEVRLSNVLEKILFPFSREGKASIISVILAAYLEISIPVAYLLCVTKKNFGMISDYWYMVLWAITFFSVGVELIIGRKNASELVAGKILITIIGVIVLSFSLLFFYYILFLF